MTIYIIRPYICLYLFTWDFKKDFTFYNLVSGFTSLCYSLCISHFVCLLRSKNPPVFILKFVSPPHKKNIKKWRIYLVFIFQQNVDTAATLRNGV